ncbi:MAG: nucleotidyltransferase family protein [Muribaculaceae bacterium]|nr:nucleotidyltransferase family protein [Muribaculaceae bacterium]
MKAMIFAAGLGTRLRPLTDNKPKALIPVNGVPMLERVMRHVIKYGLDDIVVNVHHFGNQIIDFLKANNGFGARWHISDEKDCLLDTGGGILHARQWLDGSEPFLVHNVDILTDIDLDDMLNHHTVQSSDVTMLVKKRKTSRYLMFDTDNRLKAWTNITTGEVEPKNVSDLTDFKPLAFGGIHIISPSIFSSLQDYAINNCSKFSIIPYYLSMCNQLAIRGYTPIQDYQWHDIGKPESLATAEIEFH